jgi:hypothetical protein
MKVNLNTTIELKTRLLLDEYCQQTGESIANTVDKAVLEYLKAREEK